MKKEILLILPSAERLPFLGFLLNYSLFLNFYLLNLFSKLRSSFPSNVHFSFTFLSFSFSISFSLLFQFFAGFHIYIQSNVKSFSMQSSKVLFLCFRLTRSSGNVEKWKSYENQGTVNIHLAVEYIYQQIF